MYDREDVRACGLGRQMKWQFLGGLIRSANLAAHIRERQMFGLERAERRARRRHQHAVADPDADISGCSVAVAPIGQ